MTLTRAPIVDFHDQYHCAKRELSSRGLGERYDPQTKSYRTRYGDTVFVRFEPLVESRFGEYHPLLKTIRVCSEKCTDTEEAARTVYHETLHAELAPYVLPLRMAPLLTAISYSLKCAFLYPATSVSETIHDGVIITGACLAATAFSSALRSLEEKLVSYKENGAFKR